MIRMPSKKIKLSKIRKRGNGHHRPLMGGAGQPTADRLGRHQAMATQTTVKH